MANTIRRRPVSVSTNIGGAGQFFNQVQFNGLCDNLNEVTVDQMSFADVDNLYVDENGVLVSRPPLRFHDEEAYILEQWSFGIHTLRLYRVLCKFDDAGKISLVENPRAESREKLHFLFVIRSITHDAVNYGDATKEVQWLLPLETIGWDFVPKVTCAQIEDKIFIWFAGLDFVAFNTTGALLDDGIRHPYFESGTKYLYFPIHKLVINGIESDLETKNFLTDTYRRRHQYSAISTVNFEKLIGRRVQVNVNGDMTQNTSKHLYDVTVCEHQDKMLVYPYSSIGGNYHIDAVQTPRATVVLRYSFGTHSIEVSFDGRYFHAVPTPDNIIGPPLLTRDGLWLVAFTKNGLAKCKLVAQETGDFVDGDDVLTWTVEAYLRHNTENGVLRNLTTIDSSLTPAGYFETIDQFAYVVYGPSLYDNISGDIPYVYTEWLSGSNDLVWGCKPLIAYKSTGEAYSPLGTGDDDIKVHFRYVAPTVEQQDLGAVVSILTSGLMTYEGTTPVLKSNTEAMTFFFKQDLMHVARKLRNDDVLRITESPKSADEWLGYVYRVDNTGTIPLTEDDIVYSGDTILRLPTPLYISDYPFWDSATSYKKGDFVLYTTASSGKLGAIVYVCVANNVGQTPPTSTTSWVNGYWHAVKDPRDPAQIMRQYVKIATNNLSGRYNGNLYAKWDWVYLCMVKKVRYKIESADGSIDAIQPNEVVKVTSFDLDATYDNTLLDSLFGKPLLYDMSTGSEQLVTDPEWSMIFRVGINVSKSSLITKFGLATIDGVENPASVERIVLIDLAREIEHNGKIYKSQRYSAPCRQMDFQCLVPTVTANTVIYDFVAAFGVFAKYTGGGVSSTSPFDCIIKYRYDHGANKFTAVGEDDIVYVPDKGSRWFKITPNTDTVLTDTYLYHNREFVPLPQSGELSPVIEDKERCVINNDELMLVLQDGKNQQVYRKNIHKLTSDGLALASGLIESGDLVSYTSDAITEDDYLKPYPDPSNRFIIEKLTVEESGGELRFVGVVGGEIRSGELIRLRAYDRDIVLDDDFLEAYHYPSAPAGWSQGDPWPEEFPTYPPIYPNADGTFRQWAKGDPLPSGPVLLYGVATIGRRVKPLGADENGVLYSIDGALWTSQVSDNAFIELDEYVNTVISDELDAHGNLINTTVSAHVNLTVPDHHATMNEHYFAYTDNGKNLLEVTQSKRDENEAFTKDGTDLLLYLPKRNEQLFANKITALHPLSDSEMGIFTEKDVWYVGVRTLDDGSIVYTKPIKSKIPLGLRDGDDVITGFDGQAVIFPAPRGLVALAPQDFVATTEKTLTYLSDKIQRKYLEFYTTGVLNGVLTSVNQDALFAPQIKIQSYKYWILLHKRFDREILAFDTRTGTWWVWSTPYPIRSLSVNIRLYALMQIDFSSIANVDSLPSKAPLMGVSFLWSDQEDSPYKDDIVADAMNGQVTRIRENDAVGDRLIIHRASPVISWGMMSQRLHFEQINNYKAIKSLTLNLKGDGIITAKLFTKAFRGLHHPESTETVRIKVNDLRTFVKSLNVMHVIDFQYRLENDESAEKQEKLSLNSLSIKYETKEGIR